ncbi:2-oxoacid dehydrogenases acyltransferase-domain-containing protein [Chaetomidium leptoderma]|uniref:Dihydrolipoamide acetyltransferase component of pyruvate dehydrogenase complex n=1 Tax=Chaetomidium leptoderma TaxID=669021 RepID=A0AAN6VUN6_9PEZI|nr:2-oxoacid dehydrogenases acyltransferase-domain-containing protein [Chaetomidium leptoderma]
MFWSHSSRAVRQQWRVYRGLGRRAAGPSLPLPLSPSMARAFHAARPLLAVKPVLLADIGEGIVECEIIQWFVEPGARVEEFSPLCEVQSDKASVEITSRFAGVVQKLHYDAGEMAKVGKPFVDIDIQGDAKEEDLGALVAPETPPQQQESKSKTTTQAPVRPPAEETAAAQVAILTEHETQSAPPKVKGKHASLATPAVRHLSKELNVDISEIDGTGRDGRVLKEDIHKFVGGRDAPATQAPSAAPSATGALTPSEALAAGPQQETPVALTRTQEMMFKAMTRSLTIPHFLYADEVDFTSLVELRGRLNRVLSKAGLSDGQVSKLSYLPFIIKAVSMSLYKYPVLNARVDVDSASAANNNNNNNTNKPTLVLRSQHNIGVAMDTPSGLLVPVIKNVGSLNILGIAAELARLQALAVAGRLAPQDMAGGTITVSNIGNIGGTYLSPVVVEREVAILGIGRMRTVPAFSTVPGEEDRVVRRQVTNFSWCADHRVVDGATLARAAEVVRSIVEEPDVMVMHLR